jgi:hypothetical protein
VIRERGKVPLVNRKPCRRFALPPFLGRGDYAEHIVRDDPGESAAVQIENTPTVSKEAVDLELQPGGGFVARFTRRP